MPIKRIALLAFSGLLAIPACVNDIEDGADLFEPEDTRDNIELQGLFDCTERADTGYTQGDDFSIQVVTVDGKPVEVATANAYIAMQRAAANAGVSIRVVSGFRTNSQQTYFYNCYQDCNCNNCNVAARPGYSNHQSGHALDLNTSDSGVGSWLSRHGAEFGFSRTVPSEAWHYEWWGDASDFNGPCGNTIPDPVAACDALPGAGGSIDDGDGCFEMGGPAQFLRAVNEGNDGDLVWTGVTANANPANFAAWNLNFAEAGDYSVEAFVQGNVATSKTAKYSVVHAGEATTVTVDQSGGNRWVSLGTFTFAAGAAQRVRLNDNTGEASSLGRKIVFDTLRLTRVGTTPVDPPPSDPCPFIEVTTTGGDLNVRPSASTSQAAVGQLHDGDIVDHLETVTGTAVSGNREWYRIRAPSLTGYVTAAFATCRTSR